MWYLVAKQTIYAAKQRIVCIEEVLGRENVCVIFGQIRHYLQMFSQKKNRQIINTGFLETSCSLKPNFIIFVKEP